jgi:hypothetical protein
LVVFRSEMKKLPCWFYLCFLVLAAPACQFQTTYPDKPGTLFIRQQICDLNDFKRGFFSDKNDLKKHGFLAYRFYRDIKDPKTYLIFLKCENLKQAERFIQNSNFYIACVGAGLGSSETWAGEEVGDSKGGYPAGNEMVLLRYELKDLTAWKKTWGDEVKCKLYQLHGYPEVVIAACEMPRAGQHQLFLEKLKNQMNVDNAIRLDYWIGTFLEEGTF